MFNSTERTRAVNGHLQKHCRTLDINGYVTIIINRRKIAKHQSYSLLIWHTPENAELGRVAKLILLMGDLHVRCIRCYWMEIFNPTVNRPCKLLPLGAVHILRNTIWDWGSLPHEIL